MLTKRIEYNDYDGNHRVETFYFNLSRSEVTELQLTYPGGYAEYIERTIDSNDKPKLMAMFKDIIRRSYGEKSDDGRRLIKSDELSKAFMETKAYDELFIELCTVTDAAINFINKVLPDFDDSGEKQRIIEESLKRVESMK